MHPWACIYHKYVPMMQGINEKEVIQMKLSGLQIMKNEKGFYIGKARWDKEFKKWFPHERHSPYYPTTEEVNNAFADLQIEELMAR